MRHAVTRTYKRKLDGILYGERGSYVRIACILLGVNGRSDLSRRVLRTGNYDDERTLVMNID